MTEIVLRRHRPRLLQRDAIEGCIAHDADLAVFEAEAGDQFGRQLGGHHGRGKQQKARDHHAYCTTHHRPQAPIAHQTSVIRPFSIGAAASPSAMWTLQGTGRAFCSCTLTNLGSGPCDTAVDLAAKREKINGL